MDAFDKHIRNIFENHEVPVDTEELWQKVEPSLNKKPGRKLWPVFLLVSLGILSGIYLIIDRAYVPATDSLALAGNDTSYFGKKGQLIDPVTEQTFTASQNIGLPAEEQQSTASAVQTSGKSQLTAQPKWSESFISNTVDENDEVAGPEKTLVLTGSDQNPEFTAFSTPKVDLSPLVQPVILLFQPFSKPILAVKAKFPGFRFSVDLFGGADYSQKFLVARNLDDTWYKEKREATELPLESYHFGAHLNARHLSGWFAGSGMVYYRTTELFESKDRVLVEKVTDDIVEIITHADGSIEERSGSKIILEPKSWEKRKYNAYHFIEVPVFGGYSFPVGSTQMEIYSGISFNVFFDQQGEILSQAGLPVNLEDTGADVFRKRAALSGIFGINSLIPVNERWVIFVSPVVQGHLKSITTSQYPLEQRYLKAGVRLGTRLRF